MEKRGEIASLTGLRGVAALLVVIDHYALWASVTPRATVAGVLPWTQTGSIGMAIFFTLSGYVIALNYSHWDWNGRPVFNLTRLLLYRFARLYPAYLLFAVIIFMRTPALRDLGDPQVRDDLVTHLLLWQSWFPVKFAGNLATSSYFHISWSISTECGLYVMFGFGAIIAATLPSWRKKGAILFGTFFVVAGILMASGWHYRSELMPAGWSTPEWAGWLFYVSPWTISVQFALGAVACRISQRPLPSNVASFCSNLGIATLVAVYFIIASMKLTEVPDSHSSRHLLSLTNSLLASFGTALVTAGALSPSIPNRLLSGSAIVYVGTISYSLYLFHFAMSRVAFHGQLPLLDATAAFYYIANFFLLLAYSLMVATGVYRLVEVPGRRAIRAATDRWLVAPLSKPTPSGKTSPAE